MSLTLIRINCRHFRLLYSRGHSDYFPGVSLPGKPASQVLFQIGRGFWRASATNLAAELPVGVPTLDRWRLQRPEDWRGGEGRSLVCLPAGKSLSTVGSESLCKEPGAAALSPPWLVRSRGKTNMGGASRWVYMPSSATSIRRN